MQAKVGTPKLFFKLLSQPHKHLLHGKLKKSTTRGSNQRLTAPLNPSSVPVSNTVQGRSLHIITKAGRKHLANMVFTLDTSNSNERKGKSLLWPGASQWRIYYHRMWGQLSTTCSNVPKQPNGELLVAVNHNQLRTKPSKTVDPIDQSHPPSSWAVTPERNVHSINQCNLSETRTCNRSMRGNHLAYAATQGSWGMSNPARSRWKHSEQTVIRVRINLVQHIFALSIQE